MNFLVLYSYYYFARTRTINNIFMSTEGFRSSKTISQFKAQRHEEAQMAMKWIVSDNCVGGRILTTHSRLTLQQTNMLTEQINSSSSLQCSPLHSGSLSEI